MRLTGTRESTTEVFLLFATVKKWICLVAEEPWPFCGGIGQTAKLFVVVVVVVVVVVIVTLTI